MSKVFPVQDTFFGTPSGPDIRLRRDKSWNTDDPFVKAHPHLFEEAEEDPRDAEIAALKAELAAAKSTPRKAAG